MTKHEIAAVTRQFALVRHRLEQVMNDPTATELSVGEVVEMTALAKEAKRFVDAWEDLGGVEIDEA